MSRVTCVCTHAMKPWHPLPPFVGFDFHLSRMCYRWMLVEPCSVGHGGIFSSVAPTVQCPPQFGLLQCSRRPAASAVFAAGAGGPT